MFNQEFEWSYSWNSNIGLTNISNNNKLRTFFVKEQIGIILEYDAADVSKTMKTLSEHVGITMCLPITIIICWNFFNDLIFSAIRSVAFTSTRIAVGW